MQKWRRFSLFFSNFWSLKKNLKSLIHLLLHYAPLYQHRFLPICFFVMKRHALGQRIHCLCVSAYMRLSPHLKFIPKDFCFFVSPCPFLCFDLSFVFSCPFLSVSVHTTHCKLAHQSQSQNCVMR